MEKRFDHELHEWTRIEWRALICALLDRLYRSNLLEFADLLLAGRRAMDVTQALKDAENALRDFIGEILAAKYGSKWPEQTGVTPERLEQWNKRKEVEAKRQDAGVVEERILYYADFYDLSTILKKNWPDFAAALGEWKKFEVWLKELERLRDPDAHRRELLPHQKHLILGISGEIRNQIVRYRSKQESAQDYFPRIESARDSLGNIWTPGG